MRVAISSAVVARVRALAALSPGVEVCGLLLGDTADRIERALPTANVAPHPETSFEIDPAALFAALRHERAGGPRVIGHYHSHPSGPARPSACDAAAADRSGALWLIVAGDDAGLWRAVRDGPIHGAFAPVTMIVEAVAEDASSGHKGTDLGRFGDE